MKKRATMTVTLTSFAAPWLAYRVAVDRAVVGRVRYRHPLTVDVRAGRHDVQLRHWRVQSRVLPISVEEDGHIALVAATGRPPAGMINHLTLSEWSKEYGLVLAEAGEQLPTFEYTVPYKPWRLGFSIVVAVLFASFAVSAAVERQWIWVALSLAALTASASVIRTELSRRRDSA